MAITDKNIIFAGKRVWLMLIVGGIIVFLLAVFFVGILPMKEGSKNREQTLEDAKSPWYWVFVIGGSALCALAFIGNCAGA